MYISSHAYMATAELLLVRVTDQKCDMTVIRNDDTLLRYIIYQQLQELLLGVKLHLVLLKEWRVFAFCSCWL